MRNPRRTPAPINRTALIDRTQPVSRNLGTRTVTFPPSMPVRRSRAVPMTGAQRDSNENRSDWSKSMYLSPFSAAMTPAWSWTKSGLGHGGIR
jgi:hypothetical protein